MEIRFKTLNIIIFILLTFTVLGYNVDKSTQVFDNLTVQGDVLINGSFYSDNAGNLTHRYTWTELNYSGIDDNASWNETYANTLYMDISTDNWVDTTGDTMTGALDMGANNYIKFNGLDAYLYHSSSAHDLIISSDGWIEFSPKGDFLNDILFYVKNNQPTIASATTKLLIEAVTINLSGNIYVTDTLTAKNDICIDGGNCLSSVGGGGGASKWIDNGTFIQPNVTYANNVFVPGYLNATILKVRLNKICNDTTCFTLQQLNATSIDTDTQKKADMPELYNDSDTIYLNTSWINLSNNNSIDSRVTESFLTNILNSVYATISSLSDYLKIVDLQNDTIIRAGLNDSWVKDNQYGNETIRVESMINLSLIDVTDNIGNWSSDRNDVAFVNESNTFSESQTIIGTLTATTLSGNLGWTNLNSYPSACPSNTAITTLDDSITCTTFSTVDDNTSWNESYANTLYANINSSDSYYWDKTSSTYTGQLISGTLKGYEAGNELCNIAFSNTHLCFEWEILNTIQAKDIQTHSNWTGYAWYIKGAAKYAPAPIPDNDCNGWTDSTSSYLANFMEFDKTIGGGKPSAGTCNYAKSLACCKSY